MTEKLNTEYQLYLKIVSVWKIKAESDKIYIH